MRAALLLLVIILPLIILNSANAQLGEIAGQPTFYVNISGSYTYNYTFINSGSSPISVEVIAPSLSSIPSMASSMKNATAPILTVTPLNATIAPDSRLTVTVKTYMPSKGNKPGYTWQGILQVIEQSNATTSGSGAILRAGVAKLVTITATQAVFPVLLVVAIIVIVVAIAGGLSYYLLTFRKRKAAATRAAREARRAEAKRAVAALKRPKAVAKRAAARKAARKPKKKGAAKRPAARAKAAGRPRRRTRR